MDLLGPHSRRRLRGVPAHKNCHTSLAQGASWLAGSARASQRETIRGRLAPVLCKLTVPNERPKRSVDGIGVGEMFGDVRGKEYQVCTATVPSSVLSTAAAPQLVEVVLGPKIILRGAMIFSLLHIVSAR